MLELKASRFHQAALQSGLIDEAGLAACFELIPPEKRTPEALDRRLARQTIATGRLTLWQAQQVLGGRSSGFKIDKYLLLDLLGRGGMGRVYLARDLRLNRLVALKILSQERMNNTRAIARFQREAKVGAQLQHENLVRVYDEGDAGGIRFLVMEYIEGKNVGQLIGELGSIPWPTAARLARQVALGLDHARLKELIHRDVNPCNILVTHDGTAKLTDLGLAIDLNDQDNVTRDGATVGTFDYLSPEQARHSRSVDTRADIYSLGCSLYHMIAGHVPFPVTSLPEKLYAHQLHEPDPLTETAPGVPEGLAEVVRLMMKKRPEERYQTPLEVAQALEPFAIEAGWTATATAAAAAAASTGTAASEAVTATATATAARPATAEGLEAARGGVATVAEAPSSWGTGIDVGAVVDAAASGSAGSGSNPGVAVGESFFPLDLGPDEPLLQGLNPAPRGKAKAKPKPKPPAEPKPAKVKPGPAPGGPGRIGWRPSKRAIRALAVVAAVVATAAVVGTLASFALSGPGFVRKPNPGQAETTARIKAARPIARGDIVLVFKDGESESVKTLAEAFGRASSGAGAEIVLGPGAVIRVENAKTIRVADGALTLRAAEGARPVLEVKVKGPSPMFLVNAALRLEGLTVVVKYETPADAPIFQAERELALARCTFRADGPTEGSRCILAEGRKAEVDGCLFEGFETALHVEANPGMAVSLRRSIFLSARPAEEALGRALRFRSLFGRGAGSRLSVESCSVRAGTFLEVGNFNPTTELAVDVAASAFLVKSLLTFEGDPKPPLVGDAAPLRWRGKGDRFKVLGPAWSNYPGAPADLDAWAKLTGETGGQSVDLKLAKEPPDPATPKDCALLDAEGKAVGADPAKVGPK